MGWEMEWCGIIHIPTSFFILLYPRGPFSTWKHFILNWGHSEGTIFSSTDVERLQLGRKIDGGWRPPSAILEHQKSNLFFCVFVSSFACVCMRGNYRKRTLSRTSGCESSEHELLRAVISTNCSVDLSTLLYCAPSLWFMHICVIHWTLKFCHS